MNYEMLFKNKRTGSTDVYFLDTVEDARILLKDLKKQGHSEFLLREYRNRDIIFDLRKSKKHCLDRWCAMEP